MARSFVLVAALVASASSLLLPTAPLRSQTMPRVAAPLMGVPARLPYNALVSGALCHLLCCVSSGREDCQVFV